MGRAPSRADVELAQQVTEAGYPTTDRQIRTWRSPRLGWVAPAQTKALGQGRGTLSWNAPEAKAQAIAVAQIRNGRRTSPDAVTLSLYLAGHRVSLEALRVALRACLASLRRQVGPDPADSNGAFEAAEELAGSHATRALKTRYGQRMRHRVREFPESPDAVLRSVWTGIFDLFLGGTLFRESPIAGDDDLMSEMLTASGLDAAVNDQIPGLGPVFPTHTELRANIHMALAGISLAEFERTVDTGTADDLAWGRDTAKALVSLSLAMTDTVRRTASGPPDAFGFGAIRGLKVDDRDARAMLAVTMLVLRKHIPDLDTASERVRQQEPRIKAISRLLDAVPVRYRPCLGLDGTKCQADLTVAEQDELQSVLANYFQSHPDDLRIVMPRE